MRGGWNRLVFAQASRLNPRAFVPEEPSDRPGEGVGTAILAASGGVHARPIAIVIHVIDRHDIEPAVAVEVEHGGRSAPLGVVDAGGLRNVDEGGWRLAVIRFPPASGLPPLAYVQKQARSAVFGYEKIDSAVVVDVARGHAHPAAGNIDSRAAADVAKFPLGRLAVKSIVRLRAIAAVLDKIQVQSSVVVDIHQRRARTDALGHEILADWARIMHEIDADRAGNVLEPLANPVRLLARLGRDERGAEQLDSDDQCACDRKSSSGTHKSKCRLRRGPRQADLSRIAAGFSRSTATAKKKAIRRWPL